MPHLVQLIDFADDGGNEQKKTRKICESFGVGFAIVLSDLRQ
jgi:hypothetical protein